MDYANGIEVLGRLRHASGASTDNELAKKMGLSRQSIAKARATKSVPATWIPKAAVTFGVSTDWLFFGQSSQPSSQPGSRPASRPEADACPPPQEMQDDKTDVVWIPLVDALLPETQDTLAAPAQGQKMCVFRSDFLHSKGDPRHMVLLRVCGDSMTPDIGDSDVVLVDQSKRHVAPGKLFAVAFEKAVYLKRLDYLPGKLLLSSANAAYPPVELDVETCDKQHFRILGRVLWVGRDLE